MRRKVKKQSKVMEFILSPIKILSKAREFYMKGFEDCAGRVGHGGVIVYPTAQVSRLPETFSVNSSKKNDDEEYSELLRAVSRRNIGSKVQLNIHRQHDMSCNGMGRSYSVGIGKIGRIDEDKPCSFGESDIDDVKVVLYPRSRTHAVRRSVVYH